MNKYEWQPGMIEISGLGGRYEERCRAMVKAGMEWLDVHPEADPKFRVCTLVAVEDNDDAKALREAMCAAVPEGTTGSMRVDAVMACLFIRAHGWDKYVQEMSDEETQCPSP